MLQDVKLYLSERCPLQVTLPLAAGLYLAPALLRTTDHYQWVTGTLSVWLALTVLRMVDDLVDLPSDRRCHPQRGLASGRIRTGAIQNAAAWGLVLLVGLNLSWPQVAIVALMLGWYVVYYGLKPQWPLFVHPIGVNALFFVIPLYACGPGSVSLWTAVFVGCAVVAHDLAHSVHAAGEGCPGKATPSSGWGPQRAALAAAAAYGPASLGAVALWLVIGRPPVFMLCFGAMAAWIFALCVRLVRRPCAKRARAFYVAGFVFFTLPLAGLILDRLLGLIPLS